MKILAFYLPQFHEIPENNKWWGNGFTDWVNVKKAECLMKGHSQPKRPLNLNYYDLSDTNVMVSQAKLAKDYGVYGFCYYHYWFNGKKLLEKPLETMLDNKSIDIPFCLSWANEPWARTWDGRDSDILMPQSYGGKNDWNIHFQYLLNFFNDKRYIKIENKPLFVIYKTMHIPNIEEMCQYWNDLSIKNGFDGIYFVETLGGIQSKPHLDISSAAIEFEPNYTMAGHEFNFKDKVALRIKRKLHKGLTVLNYDKIWKKILTRDINRFNKKIFLSGFTDWDNTARKGYNGIIYKGSTPDKFGKYISKQIKRSDKEGFIFINAWNEWAEGAYLEPDERHGYGYLSSLKNALLKSKKIAES